MAKNSSKPGFHVGSSGSPFHTEYYGDRGIMTGPGGAPSERAPRVGPGTLGKRVMYEWNRGAQGGSGTNGRRNSGGDSDA